MTLSSMLFAGKVASLTSFFSLAYCLAFLPVCIILYSLMPGNAKKYFLLAASYIFFWLISGKLVIYLILSTFSMHYFGLWIDRTQNKMQLQLAQSEKEERKNIKKKYVSNLRAILFLAIALHIGTLLTLKYTAFFSSNLNTLFSFFRLPFELEIPKYIMPIGISFFTLQALSYIFDVYNGVIKADDNFFRLALFIGFFPQIVEGPICRYRQTADQLWNVSKIDYFNLTHGIQRILFGLMKKIVVADRLNPLVQNIFSDYTEHSGSMIAFGAVCYTVQLYMDFSGSIDAVIGTAQIFGVTLPENFQRPFFSKTISEFWKRWHITLGTWFRDYLFYPVSTSRLMKKLTSSARKKIGNHYGPLVAGSIALFCVWLCNGLWHGAAWNFIFFGLYHFALILFESLISPLVKLVHKTMHINPEWKWYKALQIVKTTVLVVIGELFFRAESLSAGFYMFRKIFTDFSFRSVLNEFTNISGIDLPDLMIVFVTVLIVFTVSLINEKGISLRLVLAKQNLAVRWAVLYTMIVFIIIFGAYGFGYTAVDPLYAQF